MGMMLRRRPNKPSTAYTNAEQVFKAMKEEQAKAETTEEKAVEKAKRGGRRKPE